MSCSYRVIWMICVHFDLVWHSMWSCEAELPENDIHMYLRHKENKSEGNDWKQPNRMLKKDFCIFFTSVIHNDNEENIHFQGAVRNGTYSEIYLNVFVTRVICIGIHDCKSSQPVDESTYAGTYEGTSAGIDVFLIIWLHRKLNWGDFLHSKQEK